MKASRHAPSTARSASITRISGCSRARILALAGCLSIAIRAGMTAFEAGDEVLPHQPCGSGDDDRPTIRFHRAPAQSLVLWKMKAGTLRIDQHDEAPEPRCVDDRPARPLGGSPDIARDRSRAWPKRATALMMRRHRRIDEAGADGDGVRSAPGQAVGDALDQHAEAGLGCTVDIVGLAAAVGGDGASRRASAPPFWRSSRAAAARHHGTAAVKFTSMILAASAGSRSAQRLVAEHAEEQEDRVDRSLEMGGHALELAGGIGAGREVDQASSCLGRTACDEIGADLLQPLDVAGRPGSAARAVGSVETSRRLADRRQRAEHDDPLGGWPAAHPGDPPARSSS